MAAAGKRWDAELCLTASTSFFNLVLAPNKLAAKHDAPKGQLEALGWAAQTSSREEAAFACRGMGANVQSSLQVDACVLKPAVLQGGFLPCSNRTGIFQAAAAFLADFPQHVWLAALQTLQHSSRARVVLLQGVSPGASLVKTAVFAQKASAKQSGGGDR